MKIKYSKRGLTFSFQENETFKVGTRYRYLVDATNSEVILLPDENGKYKFSRKGINKPLVDLRNEEIREVMSMARFMEVEIQDDKIIVHIIKTDVNIDTLTAHQLTDLLEKSELISFSIDKEILQENNAALREMLQVGGFFSEQSRNDISYVFDVVSLFSGAGLLDLPFKKDPSFDIKFAVDFDKAACETYKKNLGDHILCMDIRNLKEEDVPECELIMGGVCCQGYSNANRAGNATLDLSKRLLVDD